MGETDFPLLGDSAAAATGESMVTAVNPGIEGCTFRSIWPWVASFSISHGTGADPFRSPHGKGKDGVLA